MGFAHDRVEQKGHTVDYFGADDLPEHMSSRRRRFSFPFRVYHHIRRMAALGKPYDVVNIHEPSAFVVAGLKRFLGRTRLVVTSHGLEERALEVMQEDSRLGRQSLSCKSQISARWTIVAPSRYSLRRADYVFCLNEEDRQYLIDKYAIADRRITRIFPGADTAYAEAFSRRRYDSPADRVLWFGTWLVRKGTPDFVAAMVALAARFPALKIAVMGAGFSREAVLADFPQSLHERIEYVPSASGDGATEYANQMLRSAVYVLPSVFEGTPLTLVESMATGLPVVTTNTCGMKDVIRHNHNGLLTPTRSAADLTEAIGRLLQDAPTRERIGRQAHEDAVANYSWDTVAEPIIAVYGRIADEMDRGIR